MQEIKIPFHRLRILRITISCFVFIILSLWMLFSPLVIEDSILSNPLLVRIAGGIGALLFSFLFYVLVKNYPPKDAALQLTEKGILENSTKNSVGFIPWEEVSNIARKRSASQEFMIIELHDPQKWIDAEQRPLLKRSFKANLKIYGSPIIFAAVNFKIKPKEFYQLLNDRLAAFEATTQDQ